MKQKFFLATAIISVIGILFLCTSKNSFAATDDSAIAKNHSIVLLAMETTFTYIISHKISSHLYSKRLFKRGIQKNTPYNVAKVTLCDIVNLVFLYEKSRRDALPIGFLLLR